MAEIDAENGRKARPKPLSCLARPVRHDNRSEGAARAAHTRDAERCCPTCGRTNTCIYMGPGPGAGGPGVLAGEH
eukprot:6489246-Prymnesium_polylepis.1